MLVGEAYRVRYAAVHTRLKLRGGGIRGEMRARGQRVLPLHSLLV